MRSTSDPGWPRLRSSIVSAIRSGRLTSKAAASELGVSPSLVDGWIRAERRRARRTPRSAFAQVTVLPDRRPSSGLGFSVSLRGGRRVRVASGFDGAELARLVRTLESC